jgi:hypothetical protein
MVPKRTGFHSEKGFLLSFQGHIFKAKIRFPSFAMQATEDKQVSGYCYQKTDDRRQKTEGRRQLDRIML